MRARNIGQTPPQLIKAFRWLGFILIFMGVSLAGWHVWFIQNSEKVEGVVVDAIAGSSKGAGYRYRMVYEYSDKQGKMHRQPSGFSSSVRAPNGTVRVLFVHPSNYDDMLPDTFEDKWLVSLVFLGLGFFVAGMSYAQKFLR